MSEGMDHERHRFSYMSTGQLERRLSRISKPDKLLNFALIAEEQGYDHLAMEARNKFARLTGHTIGVTGASAIEVTVSRKTEKEKKQKPAIRVIRS